MPKAMMMPDDTTYKATIGACEKGRPGERHNFLNLMPKARVVLNDFIYSATISACVRVTSAKSGRWQLALNLLNLTPAARFRTK